GVSLSAGALNVGNAGALGTQALTITGGTIDNTSGADLVSSTNNPQNWGGSFTFTGSKSLDLGTGPVTLTSSSTVTTAANTLAVGAVGANGNNFGLTKLGGGTLRLKGANTFGGPLVINQGTVILDATQNLASPTNNLPFGNTAGATTTSTLTLS